MCVCFHPAHISAPLTHRNHIDMHLWMEIDEHFASTLNYRQSVKWVFHVMYPAAFRPRRFRGFADDVSTHTRARARTRTRAYRYCVYTQILFGRDLFANACALSASVAVDLGNILRARGVVFGEMFAHSTHVLSTVCQFVSSV